MLSSAVWLSTGALAQTAKTADSTLVSTGAQAQTTTPAAPAQTSATMATIANPAPGSTVAQVQTPTTAKPKAKHKQPKPVAADPPAADVAPWWFHGTVEAGGRDFTNNPEKNGQTAAKFGFVGGGSQSLSGYYRYTDIKPGAFGNFDISAGSPDGLYRIDAGGRNVGYNDQSYYFDVSKAGEQYFNFIWDQSPHLYSMNAITPFEPNGNTVTFLPNIPPGTATTATGLRPYGALTDIGIDRDTAAGSYRWTPNDWDFNLDYSHTQRTGTQPTEGFSGNVPAAGGFSGTQFMKPVDDSTQNYDANGEYVGTSPWGMRYVFSAGYAGSQYQDSYNSYLVQMAPGSSSFATFSNWPSNQANGVSSTLSADLPWKSRYVGTVQYTLMQQNAAFVDGDGYLPSGQPSLDGSIHTLLSNNTVTTKLTDTVTAKTTFRYYDFKNGTPELPYFFNGETLDTAPLAGAADANSISMGYIKTNAGEALEWRPDKYWDLGGAYEFERYDWTRADVDVTNQNGGKLFADYKPFTWLTSRSSVEYSDRRYENYDYCDYVGNFQWAATAPCLTSAADSSAIYSSTQRQLMIDNRQLWKANYSLDVVAFRNFTVTPWTKYQDASYGVDPTTQQGLQDARDWNFGVDGVYVIAPGLSLMGSYSRMYGTENMFGSSSKGPFVSTAVTCATGDYALACQNVTYERNVVNTFVAAVDWAAIPDRLNTELRYTASHGTDDLNFDIANGTFPENKVWFQRVDGTLVYTFDPQQVAALGWKGDLKAKLNYAWQLNSETNWANDPLALSTASSALVSGLWMGWYNPNYNVQMLSASLVAGW